MKNILIGILLLIAISTVSYANDYSLRGNNVYYKKTQIAYIEYSYGWKVICTKGRKYGNERLENGTKQRALQHAINECKKK